MKQALYAGLVFGVVPVQTTILHVVSLGGVRPDLCLIVTCLAGFLAGELEGMFLGLMLGFVQDLFSAGGGWLNMASKGAIGLLAGLAAKHLTRVSPKVILATLFGLSCLSSLIFLIGLRVGEGLIDELRMVRSVLLPQAVLDATLGTSLYWLIAWRVRMTETARGLLPGGGL